jgi:hypothetical protein
MQQAYQRITGELLIDYAMDGRYQTGILLWIPITGNGTGILCGKSMAGRQPAP